MRIYNFFETGIDYTLAPETAIKFYQDKGLRTSFAWQDMIGQEHDQAFTVAKMLDVDLLATVQDKMNRAIAEGTTFQTFANELIPQLQKAGWWGKQDVTDPLTGDIIEAQLGSASRLENIFRTNMQSAYSVGEWEKIQEQKHRLGYLMYDAVDDDRTREPHAEQDEEVHPVDSPYWAVWFPPNGWRCRCGTIQMDEDDLAEYGFTISPEKPIETKPWTNPRTGKTHQVPEGIDPGWDHNPAQHGEILKELLAEKVGQLTKPQQAAAATGIAATEAAAASTIGQALAEVAEAEILPAFTEAQAQAIISKEFKKRFENWGTPHRPDRELPGNLAQVPEPHLQSLHIYTTRWYEDINPPLWKGIARPSLLAFRDLMNDALRLAKKYKGISTRGMTLKGKKLAEFIAGHQKAYETGAVVRYNAFTSSKAGMEVAPNFEGNIIIRILGDNGVDIRTLSYHDVKEAEVLYPAGTHFIVEHIEPIKDGRTTNWLIELLETTTYQGQVERLDFKEKGEI